MKKVVGYFLMMALLFSACVSSETKTDAKTNPESSTKAQNPPKPETTVVSKDVDKSLRVYPDGSMQRSGIRLTPVKNSSTFSDASLKLVQPADGAKLKGATRFEYTVENYILGNQTPDANDKMCANSKQGQHIHSILNNQPYNAYYRTRFSQNLGEGHYVHLAFLSRSYHESIKTPSAYQLSTFTIGDVKRKFMFDKSAAHMFYSRPKGNYIGPGNIEKILLDFYLVNTELAARGNKVKLSINGTEFILTKWVPYLMEGLPLGENDISLELIDSKGKRVPGPFNFVERKFHLYEDEPLIDQ